MGNFPRARIILAHILIGVIIFIVMNTVVILFAQEFIPYNTRGYPYKDFVDQYNLPLLLQPLANFDGAQYIIIAADKYFTYQQAYFPLYPLLVRFSATMFMYNYAATGLIVSSISFIGGLYLLNKLATLIYPETNPDKRVLHPIVPLLLALPCSFFFSAVYTESLFLFLVLGATYFLFEKNPFLAGIFGYFTSLTRFAGILLLIPIGIELFMHRKKYSYKQMFVVLVGPIAGLLTYMSFLYLTTHDAFAFINSQTAFSNNRSTSAVVLPQVLYRYLKIFTSANFDMAYVIAMLEFGVFTVYLVLLVGGLWKMYKEKLWLGTHGSAVLGVLLFSGANLILPTLTGTLSSIPRYSLLSIAVLPLVLQSRPWFKWGFVIISIALHMIVLALFAQGWFVS